MFTHGFGNNEIFNNSLFPLDALPGFRHLPQPGLEAHEDPVFIFVDRMIQKGAWLVPNNGSFDEASDNQIIRHAFEYRQKVCSTPETYDWATRLMAHMNQCARVQALAHRQ